MTNPFGINLSFAVKRWVEPEIWAALLREELEIELVQMSFDMLDPWWPEELTLPLARRIRHACEAQGLQLHSSFVGLSAYSYNGLLHPEVEGRKAALQWWERAIHLAAEMGAPAVGGPLGGMSVTQFQTMGMKEARYQDMLEAIAHLSSLAKAQGLQSLLIEPTPLEREMLWTTEAASKLLQDLDGKTDLPVRYTLDMGHMLYQPLYGATARPDTWLELGSAIGLIHLQQTDGQSDSHWGFSREGIVDVAQLSEQLQAASLSELPLILEVFYPFELSDAQVLEDIKHSVQHCQAMLAS